ncbi:MAG: caspase family protein [Planctomycetota bacterium]
MPRLYALLSGVNDYTPNVGSLKGCLNDVDHYERFLCEHFPPEQLFIRTLKDSEVTRQAIIDGFRNHLSQAGPDDYVLFQFSGHGARWKSAPEFHSYYPDGFDEGLVCWDSRREHDKPGSYDLADKELAVLVQDVSNNDQHVVVILDCCHSGSGTRSADLFRQMKPRMTHQVDHPRPLESYLDGYYANKLKANEQLLTPSSRHILLAACERHKQAFESKQERGIFSLTLLDMLGQFGGQLSYADLFLRIRGLVQRKAVNQTPQFESYRGFNSRAGFLGASIKTRGGPQRFPVAYDLATKAWIAQCGALQGINSTPDHSVELSLFDDLSEGELQGTARPTQIGLSQSQIELDFESSIAARYFAEISSLPTAPTCFGMCGDQNALEILKSAADPSQRWSKIQLLVDDDHSFAYRVEATIQDDDGPCFLIVESSTGDLVFGVRTHSERAANMILATLDQIATWQRLLNLQNDDQRSEQKQIPFQFVQRDENGDEIRHESDQLRFELNADNEDLIKGKFVTCNKSGQKLHTLMLYFSDRFGLYVLDNDEFPAADKERTILLNGDPELELYLDSNDPPRSVERFMLVVSNEPIDDFLIEPAYQPDASSEDPSEILEPIQWGEIVDPKQGRKIRTGKQKVKKIQWFTKTIEIELNKLSGNLSDKPTSIANNQIVVQGHSKLKGNIVVAPIIPGGRSVEASDDFCRALESKGLTLCNLSQARGESVSVVELSQLEQTESLAEEPLLIDVHSNVNEDELLIPIAFDGQWMQLVGDVSLNEDGSTRIAIDELPAQPSGQRSIFSTVKLYLFKTYLQSKDVNSLSYVRFTDDGFTLAQDGLPAKIAKAKKILLLIPGMIGDGHQMVQQWQASQTRQTLTDDELILTYDYESLNTKLESTSRDLAKQLKRAGISGADASMKIIGHSTGGLIARWLIERESGNDFVDSAVLCGTPNFGSPLGQIGLAKSVAKTLTTLAINFLPGIGLLGSLLHYLVKLDSLTVTMEQLNPESEFLSTLNESKDPEVAYTLVAGNAIDAELGDTWVAGLLKRLSDSKVHQLAFNGAVNDLLVSAGSAQHIDRSRKPSPTDIELACHHFAYLEQVDNQMPDDWSFE